MDREEDSPTPAEEPTVSEPTDPPEHSGSRWEPRSDGDEPSAAMPSPAAGSEHDAGVAASPRRRGRRVAAVVGAAVVLAGGGFGAGFAVGHSGPDGGPGGGIGHHRGHDGDGPGGVADRDGDGGRTAPGQTGQTGQAGQPGQTGQPTSAGTSAILGGLFT
jgi:hypothetical protein